MFPDRSKRKGIVYIATSPEKQRRCLFKIGLTTNKTTRVRNFKTADPDMEIVAEYSSLDIKTTEKMIHDFLHNARYKGEFFYISSLEICKSIVERFCNFHDTIFEIYKDDNKLLQQYYTKNDILKEAV